MKSIGSQPIRNNACSKPGTKLASSPPCMVADTVNQLSIYSSDHPFCFCQLGHRANYNDHLLSQSVLKLQSISIQFKMQSSLSKKDDELFDQSPKQTIMRQLIAIGHKIRYVVLLLPRHRESGINDLKNWDLWGPLLICIFFALSLALFGDGKQYRNDDFINIFIMFWLGAFLISINCRLLGNKGSLFQSMSAVGYCLFPLAILGLFVSILPNGVPIWIKLPIIIVALCWSTISCLIVMRDLVNQEKKWLCAYPVFLFYVFMAWYAIVA